MVTQAYNQAVESGKPEGIQGHPQLHSKFEASLDYETLSQKTKKHKKLFHKN